MYTQFADDPWLPPTLRVPARTPGSSSPHGALVPPRLAPIPMPATAGARRTVATLRFPVELIHDRAAEYAAEYAARARASGQRHTLRVWRDACHAALLDLARVATAVPARAACAELRWRRDGADYAVSATFIIPPAGGPTIH